MKYYARPLNKLIGELSKLQGIGNKTAQRLAFNLLAVDKSEALALAYAIIDARENMSYCSECGNLTDQDPCLICKDTPVSYTHLRAHETDSYLVCRLLLEKKKKKK